VSDRVGVVIDHTILMVCYEFYTENSHIAFSVGLGVSPYTRIVIEHFEDMPSLLEDLKRLAPTFERIRRSHSEGGGAFRLLSKTFLDIEKATRDAEKPALEELREGLKELGFEVF